MKQSKIALPKSSRMQHLAQSDIRRMTLECEELGGINLGQGICDLPTIPALKRALALAVEDNKATYSRYDGIEPLRRAVSNRLADGGTSYDLDSEVVITVGATGAFAMTMMAILNPGDEVLLPEPFYGYHWNTIVALGGVPKPVAMQEPNFALSLEAVEEAISPATKVIVVCSPANPSGKVWSAEELDGLIGVLERHNLWAVTDEIYQDILYDGREHISLASRPGGRERTVTVSGFSKTFSITGWRIGYAAAPSSIAASIGILNDLFYVCAPTPLQHAVAGALESVPPSYYAELSRDYQQKRDRLVETCLKLGWKPRIPEGAYYLMVEPTIAGASKAVDLSNQILREAGVASVPGSAFYRDGGGEHLVRFCFAKTMVNLDEACARLQQTY